MIARIYVAFLIVSCTSLLPYNLFMNAHEVTRLPGRSPSSSVLSIQIAKCVGHGQQHRPASRRPADGPPAELRGLPYRVRRGGLYHRGGHQPHLHSQVRHLPARPPPVIQAQQHLPDSLGISARPGLPRPDYSLHLRRHRCRLVRLPSPPILHRSVLLLHDLLNAGRCCLCR